MRFCGSREPSGEGEIGVLIILGVTPGSLLPLALFLPHIIHQETHIFLKSQLLCLASPLPSYQDLAPFQVHLSQHDDEVAAFIPTLLFSATVSSRVLTFYICVEFLEISN